MRMRPFGRLLPVETARRRVLAAARPVARAELVPLDAALGRVAARGERAPRPVPAFARATWDGYAVRSADLRGARPDRPVRLEVIGEIFAEDAGVGPVGAGQAVAIATGGCLPAGADAVVIFEETRRSASAVTVRRPVAPGDRVAEIGSDYRRGERIVGAGAVLDPAALGGLAEIGRSRVRVRARPVVALIPNGNELVAPGGRLGRGQIFESNNRTISAVVRAAGGLPRPLAPVPDDPVALERALRRALAGSDLVVATGGSSVGERDLLPQLFPRIGRLLFHGIAVRPGKPTLAAVAGRRILLGMPGHPTSCLSNAFWLLLPLVRRLAGLPGPGWTDGVVRVAEELPPTSAGLASVVPLRVARGWGRPTFRDSSAITSLAGVNAFALRAPGAPAIGLGGSLPVHFLGPPIAAAAPEAVDPVAPAPGRP